MPTDIRTLGPGDERLLANVAQGVFDFPVRDHLATEFLEDPRHHIAVAVDGGVVVGFASAVHYVHPDKDPELWVNEVGVAPTHQRQGLARRLMDTLFEVGRRLGCVEAWVLTEQSNARAMRLYASLGGTTEPEETVMFSFALVGTTREEDA